ncbi:MAG: efflux RND transporter permease subunit, partial [Bacteroidota bacterium]
IVMAAIPFGLIGALVGHLLFGLHLGMLSVAGLIGLSGVIVNDSLVLVDFVNEQRRKGLSISEAIVSGAKLRFRPIMLTTVTTFLGMLPLLLERSVQAQFLIPMAVSLSFGILFATFVILLLVPALAQWQDDVLVYFGRRNSGRKHFGRESRGHGASALAYEGGDSLQDATRLQQGEAPPDAPLMRTV